MYNLSDVNVIRRLLTDAGFSFKKSLGQNFLIDGSVCPEMAMAAAEQENDFALEIGPGVGVLTAELSKEFEKVVTVELDERLRPVLAKTLKDADNVEVIWGDAMKLPLAEIIKQKSPSGTASVCANLPYYITSPIIMMLLESNLPIRDITVMVQKEAAERICAEVGTRAAGVLTVSVGYYAEPEILFEVPRTSFMPSPEVDSAVIKLKIRKEPPVKVANEKQFFSFVKAAFGQRRKTLQNSLSSLGGYLKADISEALERAELRPDVRAEALNFDELARLFNELYDIKSERSGK